MGSRSRFCLRESLMFEQMKGKVALVTGAASGIGRASALGFAKVGSRVIVADRDRKGGLETVDLIEQLGAEAVFEPVDVSNIDQVEALIAGIVARFGRLDYALNNAGAEAPQMPLHLSTEGDWDRCLAINLKGVWACMRAELRQMVGQPEGGVIVNTSSLGGLIAVPENCAYAAAKHGVIGLTKTAAVEYAQRSIRVNALCPGVTWTPMMQRLTAEAPDLLQKIMPPMGRAGTPEEMAGLVVFLCSPAASYINGQAIAVDGAALAV